MPDTIGHNLPPTDADPLRDRLSEEHAALMKRRDELLEATDRAPAVIEDEDTAGKMTDFIKQVQAAIKAAEGARVAEKEPFLAAGRTVDGWFKKMTDPLADAKKKLERVLTEYQRKKAERERREREEAARREREEAERAAREAAERAAALQSEADLAGAIVAEEAAAQAAADAARAAQAAAAKPADLSRSRGDYGGVASLRTFWDFEGLDRDALDLEALRPHIPADALEKAVRSFVKAGGRQLRGVRIFENTQTVVR